MIVCKSECDCDARCNNWEHAPDCHSRKVCDWDGEGAYCDAHFEEAALDNASVLRSPIGSNCGGSTDAATQDRMRQEMADAGRDPFLGCDWRDMADMARMRAKDGQ